MDYEHLMKLNFALFHIHKWSIGEIEEMTPFEREVYVFYLNNYIAKRNEKMAMQAKKTGVKI